MRKFHTNSGISCDERCFPIKKGPLTMQGMLEVVDIRVKWPSTHNRVMHFFPHECTMRDVVLPGNVKQGMSSHRDFVERYRVRNVVVRAMPPCPVLEREEIIYKFVVETRRL
jgi:hypothetical protein